MLSMSKPELFPFPSPQHMLFLSSPSWWMELLHTSHSVQTNLAVILNTLTFLTSSMQAFNRFPPNVLCHPLTVTIGLHISGSSGCSSIFVWLRPLYCFWRGWPSLPNEKVFFSFDICNTTLLLASLIPLNMTGFSCLFVVVLYFFLGFFLSYTFSWWSHLLPKSKSLSLSRASGLYN